MGKKLFKDVATGEEYELVDLPAGQASWMFAPHLLYECGGCRTKFKSGQQPGLCPSCKTKFAKHRI